MKATYLCRYCGVRFNRAFPQTNPDGGTVEIPYIARHQCRPPLELLGVADLIGTIAEVNDMEGAR